MTDRPCWITVGFCFLVATAEAGDWPQILGPARNGVAQDEAIRRDWQNDQPQTIWQHEVGQGYAGVAVVGQHVVVHHRVANEEVVEALDAASGKRLWKHHWKTRYVGRIDPDTGPRCVPTLVDDAAYVQAVDGRIVCLSLEDGQERWARNTARDFKFREGYFGVGSSPIVIDGKLLANVGGRQGAGIVAFSTDDGRTLWKATDEQASYSSPVETTIDGRRLVLFVTRLQFLGLDPDTGRVEFSTPFGKRGPTVNAANPIVTDPRHVFLTASYGIGAKMFRIQSLRDSLVANEIWSNDGMSSQYASSVVRDGALYGVDGRADGGSPRLRCLDPRTGRVHWTQDDFGMATPILTGNTILLMKTDGELVLIDAAQDAYRELARFRLIDPTVRALPALSNGRFYVRNDQTLRCIDLGRGS